MARTTCASRTTKMTRLLAVALTLLLLGALNPPTAEAGESLSHVVVANRGSGDISVVDTTSLTTRTVDLPGDAEPMYVNHDQARGYVFVGDRASSAVVVLDDLDYSVIASIDVGAGVFHQWYDDGPDQLWVVGDTSQTVTVVDSDTLAVEATIDIPADLIARGGKPHDVFVKNRVAFVSILGLDDGTGVVLQYSTRTFEETGRITTGADPHLFVRGFRLWVASQGGSEVSLYRAFSLEKLGDFDVPSAHGVFVTNRREVLVTNIAGGGVDALWELNRGLNRVVDTTDTDFPVPHNVTVDDRRQAWVTHSGATSDQLSFMRLRRNGFGPVDSVTVGLNPFGLAHVQALSR